MSFHGVCARYSTCAPSARDRRPPARAHAVVVRRMENTGIRMHDIIAYASTTRCRGCNGARREPGCRARVGADHRKWGQPAGSGTSAIGRVNHRP